MQRLHLSLVSLLLATLLPFNPTHSAQPNVPDRSGIPTALRLTPTEEGQLSQYLNAARRTLLNEMATTLRRTPQVRLVLDQWDAVLRSFHTPPPSAELDSLIRWMLRNAFLESERELQAYEQQADQFEVAQRSYRRESERAYRWVEKHRAAGNSPIDPPFLPDHKLDRPKPIMGPKPPAITRAMATRKEVGGYALALSRRGENLRQDNQLTQLAIERTGQRQRDLLGQVSTIRRQLRERTAQTDR